MGRSHDGTSVPGGVAGRGRDLVADLVGHRGGRMAGATGRRGARKSGFGRPLILGCLGRTVDGTEVWTRGRCWKMLENVVGQRLCH